MNRLVQYDAFFQDLIKLSDLKGSKRPPWTAVSVL